MTYTDIEDRVKEIYEAKEDSEAAHSLQDKLLLDVLEVIANNDYDDYFGPSASGLAFIALTVRSIEFSRWYS